MKNSSIFWWVIKLYGLHMVLTWRIGLGVGFMDGDGQSFFLDAILAICLIVYIGFSFDQDHEPESFVYWIKKFNSLMDREEKELDPTAFSDQLKNDPEYAKWERYFQEKSKNVGEVNTPPVFKNPPPPTMDKNKVYKGDKLICNVTGNFAFSQGSIYEAIEDFIVKNNYNDDVNLKTFFGDWKDHFTKLTPYNSSITNGKTFSNTGPK